MTRRIIQIEPTDSQWVVIDELFGLAAPFVAAVTDEHGAPTGKLWVERIVDDSEVRLYTVQPDGSYVYDERSGGGAPRLDAQRRSWNAIEKNGDG